MKKLIFSLFSLIMVLSLSGCMGGSHESVSSREGSYEASVYEERENYEYDSADTAIVYSLSTVNKTMTFYNMELKKFYTLSYSGATRFADSYDTAVSVSQVEPGKLVNILFLKNSRELVSLTESSECFVMEDVTDFTVNVNTGVFKYKSENYKITDSTILISGDTDMELSDLCSVDTVTLVGYDTDIYSIIVDCGHGYLSLANSENFVGGYIEIGSSMIEQIKDKMMLVVPVGTYEVKISKNSTEAVKSVTITSADETLLDLGDIEIKEYETGKVVFDVTPSDATLYIDDAEVDASAIQTLGYGKHKLYATADGYDELTRYFMVAEDMATLKVILDETADTSDDESDTEETESATDGYYVYITSPSDVEVYLDSYYIGRAPLMFDKEAGTHTITLKKTGYVTKTINVLIKEEEGDITYSFDDLEASSTSDVSSDGE